MPWWAPPDSTRDLNTGIDLDGKWMHVGRKSYRRKWQHGCADPIACAKPHRKPAPARNAGSTAAANHQSNARNNAWTAARNGHPGPAARPRTTGTRRRAQSPPARLHQTRPVLPPAQGRRHRFEDPKTRAGNRPVSLADDEGRMITDLTTHKAEQDRERRTAGDMWEEHGLVWCQPNGRPIDARMDWLEFKEILDVAGVRNARVHDGRHFAATMLPLQGVADAVVVAVMGWRDRRMLGRYQHVIDELRRESHTQGGQCPVRATPEKPKKMKSKKADNALEGTRTPNLLIRS